MKGQVSIFMIVGIVLIFIVALAVILFNQFEVSPDNPMRIKSQLSRYVTSCMDEIGITGATVLAAQGGYIEPQIFAKTDDLNIAYGHYAGSQTLVTVSAMEKELSNYIDSNLAQCIQSGVPRAIVGEPKTTVRINLDNVIIETECTVELDEDTETIYKSEFPVDLGKLHGMANDIIQNIYFDWIDLTGLSLLPSQVSLVPHGQDTLIYYILGNDLMFNTAVQFFMNEDPQLHLPDSFTLQDGVPWLYKVNCTDAEGDPLTIEDSSSMIETLPDGSILSTPDVPGTYDITFTCLDDHSNYDQKTIQVIVE